MADWFQHHPDSELVEVAAMGPAVVDDPDSRFVYVWIRDGDEVLNVYLVRQGCFNARSILTGLAEEHLQVGVDTYHAVVRAAEDAEAAARAENLGLWADSER